MFDLLEDEFLSHLFVDPSLLGSYAAGAYLALNISHNGEAAPGTQVTGGGYARVNTQGNWTVSNGEATNTAAITFPTATGDWTGPIVGMYITTTPLGFNLPSFYVDFEDEPWVTVKAGRTFEIPAGALTIRTKEGGNNGRSTSVWVDESLLNHVLNDVTWANPPATWVGLSLLRGDRTGSFMIEPGGANYKRVQVEKTLSGWNIQPLGTGTGDNFARIQWEPAEPGNWGMIYSYAIFDAETGGNMLWWSELDVPTQVTEGEAPYFEVAALTFTLT